MIAYDGAAKLSVVRNDFEVRLRCLNVASKLWGLFKALISGALIKWPV